LTKRKPFTIAGVDIAPGRRGTVDLPTAQLYTHTPMAIPVHVVHGRRDGPRLFVTAAIHGDELNGIEIIRQVLEHKVIGRLHGTLVCVPVVNIFGFVSRSRYLPDRRDLNRVFPGSAKGSLASRLANTLMTEIVSKCTHGIDLHTAAIHRENLPQVRAHLEDPDTNRLARAFGTAVIIDANLRDGSLRLAAADMGIPMLLYEAGEALRFKRSDIQMGVRGVLRVMRFLGMIPMRNTRKRLVEPVVARSSFWLRAPESGVLRFQVGLGAHVRAGDLLGTISDPFGGNGTGVTATGEGIVIGRTTVPVVNEGDGLVHIARLRGSEAAAVAEALRDEEKEPENIDEVRPTGD
jgi:hypothetical protein